MLAEQRVSQGHGVVVLAAYRPDPELFAIQLRSIRDQTRRDFRCLIGADGGQEGVRALVAETVGDDPRFEVIGWGDNLGFYLNFERLLMAVPADAAWVALSDQDDHWNPFKLERLVPLLDDVPLATGQARVVRWPSGNVVLRQTDRRVVSAQDLVFQNQVTGAASVLQRRLLEVALPFPRLHTVTQLHDHWLALCAAATGGYAVLNEVVQDYVQHGANAVGEISTWQRMNPRTAFQLWVRLADHYEGGHDRAQLLRVSQTLSFGWRRVMLSNIRSRLGGDGALPAAAFELARPGRAHAFRAVARAALSRDVAASVVATFVAGLPAELARSATTVE